MHKIYYENGATVTQQSWQKYAERLSQQGILDNLDKIKKCCKNGAIFTQTNWDTFAEHIFTDGAIYCEKHVQELINAGCIITIQHWEWALNEQYFYGEEVNEYVIIKCDELDIIKENKPFSNDYWQETLDKIMDNQDNYDEIEKLINICVKYGAVAK